MFKTTLNLDVLEAREVPAFIGLVKGGPQLEPPTVVGTAALVTTDVGYAKWAVSPSAVGGKTGMLLPSLSPAPVQAPTAAPNAILFPVFIGR